MRARTRLSTPARGVPAVGAEIFFDDKTDNQTGITTITDLVNLDPCAFTVPAGQVYEVEVEVRWATNGTVGGTMLVGIADGSNVLQKYAVSAGAPAANGSLGPVRAIERIATPGTYTRKGRVQGIGGTAAINAGAAYPTTIKVRRVR